MIRDILHLHAPGKPIDCDPTYSTGNFYKNGLPQPKYKFDKTPQTPDTVEATADNLPLENESIEVLMFDPPFVIGGQNYATAQEGSNIIAKRFTSFPDFKTLKEMYSGSLKEFYRILKTDGIVIFKCQDCIAGGKQYFTHSWLMYEALKIGFYPKDLFILLSKNRMTDDRKQQHARKFHSYSLVFQKQSKPTTYYEDKL